jgi:hypothetical protein
MHNTDFNELSLFGAAALLNKTTLNSSLIENIPSLPKQAVYFPLSEYRHCPGFMHPFDVNVACPTVAQTILPFLSKIENDPVSSMYDVYGP